MKIREEYLRWSLGTQLQSTFISSALVLVAILIIITRFQLDWLSNEISNESETVFLDSLRDHMRYLGEDKSKFVTQEFKSYMELVTSLMELDSLVLGLNPELDPPIEVFTYVMHDEIPEGTGVNSNGTIITMQTGVFYSRYSQISDEGYELIAKEAAMDKLYPHLYRNSTQQIYSGFELDEIIHYYPGSKMTYEYSPLVKEWYYKAKENKGDIIITEPYLDTSINSWMISVSTAILQSGVVYGVAAADISLYSLTKKVSNTAILDSGFILMVSAGGMILSRPLSWIRLGATIRIYDEEITGISESLWNSFKNSTSNDEFLEFTGPNSTEYYSTIHPIAPYDNIPDITHYLIICAPKTEARKQLVKIEDDYSDTYVVIFWVVIAISICTFIIIAVLLNFAANKIKAPLLEIRDVATKISNRCLYPNLTKGCNVGNIKNEKLIGDLAKTFVWKVKQIDQREKEFGYYSWGMTRPNDQYLFNSWKKKLYPFNIYEGKQMAWRAAFPNLVKVSESKK